MCLCLFIFIGGKRVVFLLFPPPPSSGEPAFVESWWCPWLTSLVSSPVAFSFLSGTWSRMWMQVHAQDRKEFSGKGSWWCPAFRCYSHCGWSPRAPESRRPRFCWFLSFSLCCRKQHPWEHKVVSKWLSLRGVSALSLSAPVCRPHQSSSALAVLFQSWRMAASAALAKVSFLYRDRY